MHRRRYDLGAGLGGAVSGPAAQAAFRSAPPGWSRLVGVPSLVAVATDRIPPALAGRTPCRAASTVASDPCAARGARGLQSSRSPATARRVRHRSASSSHYSGCAMASKRQIDVGGVKIGGGAPVAVQSMTKTETADYDATMRQIHAIAEAGGDLVRCAVPRDDDVRALERIVRESPIPDHRRHPLQPHARAQGDRRRRPLRPHQPRQHRRPREGRRGRREGARRGRSDADRGQLRLAAQAPPRARARERGRGARRRRHRARRADGAAPLRGLQGLRSSRPACPTRSPPTGSWPSGSTIRSTSASPRRARSGPAR